MLTFVRNGELRVAEWAEFDLDRAEWSIPAAKMKMKAPHIVPLADWTLELSAELKELTGHSHYLFPSVKDPDKHMSENNATISYTYTIPIGLCRKYTYNSVGGIS